jgi:soluble lytic murein transglycosylase-like protein
MSRTLLALAVSAMLLPVCTGERGTERAGSAATPGTPSATSGPTASASPSPTAEATPSLPEPDARIPRRAGSLARELEATSQARRAAVRRWIGSGRTGAWPPPDDVELLVLHEQRIYRVLAAEDRLAARVYRRLPGAVAREAAANVRAGGALYDHFAPVKKLPDFQIRAPEPADVLRRYFGRAEARFGVDWEVLAAVMLIETRMGRIVSNSSAGAQGPMQFIPSTWAAYGMGGDVRDERDAILGAANYLSASGAPTDYRQALYHYNPVPAYVTAVTGYASAMERDPDLFYAYYNWQVFVRTSHGDVRLTGPGL